MHIIFFILNYLLYLYMDKNKKKIFIKCTCNNAMHNGPTSIAHLKNPITMVQLQFRSLMHLDIPAIKEIGQQLLVSKPWSKPIGPNNTRYQGTPPKGTNSNVTRRTKTKETPTISDFHSFLNSL